MRRIHVRTTRALLAGATLATATLLHLGAIVPAGTLGAISQPAPTARPMAGLIGHLCPRHRRSCASVTRRVRGTRVTHPVITVRPDLYGVVVDPQAGHAFSGGDEGHLLMVSTATGAVLRTVTLPSAVSQSASGTMVLAEREDHLFLLARAARGALPDTVSMFDARGGLLLRTASLPAGGPASQIAVVARTARVFVLGLSPVSPVLHVSVLDAASGRVVRTIVLPRLPGAVAASSGAGLATLEVDQRTGQVILTELDSATLHALDGTTGRVLWTRSLRPGLRVSAQRPLLRSPVVDAPSGHLFVADFPSGDIRTLDARTGHLIRTVRVTPGGVDMVAIQRTGHVAVFYGGRVSMLDAASGRLLRTNIIGRVYDYGPAVVDQASGRIFLSNSRTRSMVVLDGASGRMVRSVGVGQGQSPLLPLVDERADRVLVPTLGPIRAGMAGNGSISVLNGRSGLLLRTIPTGQGLSFVHVDEQTGHALIMSEDGHIQVIDVSP